MKRHLLLAAAICSLAAPAIARAQLVAGVQTGVGLLRGDLVKDVTMEGDVKVAVPVELVLGWRLSPALTLGLQGGYGFTWVGDTRDKTCAATGVSCSSHLWQLGGRADYAFGEGWVRPYAAGILGWQWLTERWSMSSSNWDESTWSGWQLGAEGGVAFPMGWKLRGAGYVGLGLGEFVRLSEEGRTAGYAHSDSGGVPDRAVHYWLGLGFRVTYAH